MLRDKSLVPFSHQHQHALALCVRIHRGIESGDTGLRHWQAEIRTAFETEIEAHFDAEEQILFPVGARFDQLRGLVAELAAEHIVLRSYSLAAMAMSLGRKDLIEFATILSNHVRKEEQDFFQSLQALLSPVELADVGAATETFFRSKGLLGEARANGPEL
jgi:hemerythrin-like domain-containing protein